MYTLCTFYFLCNSNKEFPNRKNEEDGVIDFCCLADPEILPFHVFELHYIMSGKMKIVVVCRLLLVLCNYISGGQAGDLTMFDPTCTGNANFQSIISCQYGLDLT